MDDQSGAARAIHRFKLECEDEAIREWLLAEAFEAGAEGAEESELDGRFRADIYAPPEHIERVRTTLSDLEAPGAWLSAVEILPPTDWSEAWKEGLEALEISDRLLVRPPFVEVAARPGQHQIVIDPGQAFGTGNHASTRLCLEWIDALSRETPFERVLDVGTGSGVLALAARALGARQTLGFDLDPVATEAAQEAARANDLEAGVRFVTAPIEDVDDGRTTYPLVLANLLKREMLPIADEIARRVASEGRLVLAGLLVEDLEEVLLAFEARGLVEEGRRESGDAIGLWVSPCLVRRA